MPEPGGGKIESRVAVGESADHTGASSDLAHQALQRIIGAQASPMFLVISVKLKRLVDMSA